MKKRLGFFLLVGASFLYSCNSMVPPVNKTTPEITNTAGIHIQKEEFDLWVPDYDKAISVEIAPLEISILPSEARPQALQDNPNEIDQQSFCQYDFNNNKICENPRDREVSSTTSSTTRNSTLEYDGDRNTCYNPSSQWCEFSIKNAKSQSVKATVSGKFTAPIFAEAGFSSEYSYTWSVETGSSTRVSRGGCAVYRVYLSRVAKSGYYSTNFYESTGLFTSTKVGNYRYDAAGTWSSNKPDYQVRGWYRC